jgi:DNA-binding NarL/FixJ family response regulator
MDTIRLLVADDHTLYREGVRSMLRGAPGIEVAGEAASGDEVIAQAEQLQPDIILMDIKMPGMNGIEATRQILNTSPHVGILIVTMFDDDDSVFAAMRAGARGYLLKDADLEELVRAISAVYRGEAIFSPAIARRMVQYFASRPTGAARSFPELTEREREILALMAQGQNNEEIASRLILSLKTIRNHVSNIFAKLEVSDRVKAIIRAREKGMDRNNYA